MELKVGDKVRVIHFPDIRMVDKVGTIRDVRPPIRGFRYSVWIEGSSRGWIAVYEREIKPIKVGEQLLLFEL